jgi:acyl phosphate:glycerol-3-phosphate acyltransferase
VAALLLAMAYLLGSIPFSYLVARGFGVADVRSVGSGNVGATNVMRAAGRTAGLLAFVLDASKGAAASILALRLAPGPTLPALAAASAVLGHMYPVWLRFRGGKGVATGCGAFLPLVPIASLVGFVVFVAVAALSRYVSLGSVAGTLALAATAFVAGPPAVAWAATAIGVLIVVKHRSNLERLVRGAESRLGSGR